MFSTGVIKGSFEPLSVPGGIAQAGAVPGGRLGVGHSASRAFSGMFSITEICKKTAQRLLIVE